VAGASAALRQAELALIDGDGAVDPASKKTAIRYAHPTSGRRSRWSAMVASRAGVGAPTARDDRQHPVSAAACRPRPDRPDRWQEKNLRSREAREKSSNHFESNLFLKKGAARFATFRCRR
jgi:hypothetical protein